MNTTTQTVTTLTERAIRGETRKATETLTTTETITAATNVARDLARNGNLEAAARLSDWIDADAREISQNAQDIAFVLDQWLTAGRW